MRLWFQQPKNYIATVTKQPAKTLAATFLTMRAASVIVIYSRATLPRLIENELTHALAILFMKHCRIFFQRQFMAVPNLFGKIIFLWMQFGIGARGRLYFLGVFAVVLF